MAGDRGRRDTGAAPEQRDRPGVRTLEGNVGDLRDLLRRRGVTGQRDVRLSRTQVDRAGGNRDAEGAHQADCADGDHFAGDRYLRTCAP